uniref:Uncharacterized protein n=1 Tax=Desertifilum tharense IPPAS B-1220 TaxID=1781255 RepID=A0A1E5QNA9_9CYAN|nr:hypothetical protein BH720_06270 [Desertifilum tharense IPPAS B-1220]
MGKKAVESVGFSHSQSLSRVGWVEVRNPTQKRELGIRSWGLGKDGEEGSRVGWVQPQPKFKVEVRNPTQSLLMLGYANANPTYG